MDSYGETVVDRGIDEAWTMFRARLADWLDDEVAVNGLGLVPAPDDPHPPMLEVIRLDDEIGAYLHWDEHLSAAFARTGDGDRRLASLGFDDIADELSAFGTPLSHVDHAAHVVVAVLREVWGVVHPSFVGLVGDVPPRLVDEPVDLVASPASLPRVYEPASKDDLQAFVVAHLQTQQERDLVVGRTGGIPYGDDGVRRAQVSVRDAGRVEVWSVLATDVRRDAARREAERLSQVHPRHRFFVSGRSLVASIHVSATPLVLDHLDAALTATLRVHRSVADRLQGELARKHPKTAERGANPMLTAIAGDAAGMHTADLMLALVEAAEHDDDVLGVWLAEARTCRSSSWRAAKATQNDVLRAAHRHAPLRWHRVVRALQAAVGEDAPRRSGS